MTEEKKDKKRFTWKLTVTIDGATQTKKYRDLVHMLSDIDDLEVLAEKFQQDIEWQYKLI